LHFRVGNFVLNHLLDNLEYWWRVSDLVLGTVVLNCGEISIISVRSIENTWVKFFIQLFVLGYGSKALCLLQVNLLLQVGKFESLLVRFHLMELAWIQC